MAERHWTLLFITDGTKHIKQYRFPRALVQLGIAVVLALVSVLSSVGTAYVLKTRAPKETRKLIAKNELMKRDLREIHDQVLAVYTQLEELGKQDEQFRLVAGLEPLNSDVQRVGIGGALANPKEKRLWKLDREATTLMVAASNELSELLRRAQLLNFSWREARNTLEDKYDRLLATPSIIPTDGYITSAFSASRMHPILHRARPHEGIDITAPRGTPFVAAAKGRVRFVGMDGDYGLSIEVDHGYGVITRYAHASKTLVKVGQDVERGAQIGLVGETGLAVAPHLHYEVLVNGKATNPRGWLLNTDKIAD
jgi:murein DD-endopeptidase MepM/ murein hydrolase activator NlpD